MQDSDTTQSSNWSQGAFDGSARESDREVLRERIWDFLIHLFKRFILFISFGTGILGLAWLLGRIFKR